MGGIEGQAGEGQPTYQIAQHGGNFIPDKVIHDAEFAAHHQGKREQEHVHNGMLEAHQVEHAEANREQHGSGQGLPVWTVTVMAKTAARARMAPAMKARIRTSRVAMETFDSPASTILVTNSEGRM